MIWALFGVVAIGLVGVVAALATSRWRYDPMSEPVSSVADPGLPDVVHPGDVDNLRFDTALRGYRIDQVDEVLDRLRDRIGEQETMIRALRADASAASRPPTAASTDTDPIDRRDEPTGWVDQRAWAPESTPATDGERG